MCVEIADGKVELDDSGVDLRCNKLPLTSQPISFRKSLTENKRKTEQFYYKGSRA